METLKKSSVHGALIIKLMDKKLAKSMIIQNHYSHKWNEGFGIYSFGIYRQDEPDVCLGVAAYGYMKNSAAKIFKCPSTPNGIMLELNRMWISDELGYNAETILIGASLQLLRKNVPEIVAIQSFADGRLGCGTIYKAANFKYFGWHYTRFARSKRSGEVIHEQLFTNSKSPTGYVRSNIGYLLGEYDFFRVKTYRYIYPFKKDFVFTLKKQMEYPQYEKGQESIEWERDKKVIIERINGLLDRFAS